MMAISNSARLVWLAGFLSLLPGSPWLVSGRAEPTPPAASETAAARAERLYHEARLRLNHDTNQTTNVWLFARACFDLAEFATKDAGRAELAQRGIVVSRQLIAREPKLAPGHYYLALNLGQLARTKSLGALPLVDEMERAFKTAASLDANLDHAGPDRSLGLLYLDAPGWPTSIGSNKKARQHLQKAVELCPDFPDNRLCLLEALLKWREQNRVASDLKSVETILQNARAKFTGEEWAASWLDWDSRWQKIKAKVEETTRPATSPRGRR